MQSSELEQGFLKNTASKIYICSSINVVEDLNFSWGTSCLNYVILLVFLKNLVGGLAGAQTFDFPLGRLMFIQQSLRINGTDLRVILFNKSLWTHLFIAFTLNFFSVYSN